MLEFFVFLWGFVIGGVCGFIKWAPDSHFKQGFVEGLSLKIIWGRFFK